jgi:hypothetical protein
LIRIYVGRGGIRTPDFLLVRKAKNTPPIPAFFAVFSEMTSSLEDSEMENLEQFIRP